MKNVNSERKQTTTFWHEIKRHLTNTPSFNLDLEEIKKSKPDLNSLQSEQLEYTDLQIEKALKNNRHRLIFLLGPFGVGKTAQIHYFIRKRPHLNYMLRSFVKIKTLDHAFLHLTNYISRIGSLFLILMLAISLIKLFPQSGAMPFLLIASYLFAKNTGNLVYIFHQFWHHLFLRKERVIVINDLERSPLESADQWALLSNLWQLKTTYLIALGYSMNDQNAKFKALESAQKLGGVVIELVPYTPLNFSLIKQFDADFPFVIDSTPKSPKGDWLSLFTPSEVLTIYEQAKLRTRPGESKEEKQSRYISVYLEFLIAKLGLSRREINYDPEVKLIKPLSEKTLTADQAYFISSFKESLVKNK